MISRFGKLIILAGLATALAAGTAVAAEEQPPQIVGIRVGFAGHYKVGVWTPVAITLQGGSRRASGTLSLIVPDADGVPSRVATPADRPLTLEPGAETIVLLYARFGRVQSTAGVQFTVDGRPMVQREFTSHASKTGGDYYPPAVQVERRLYLVLGSDALDVPRAVALTESRNSGGEPVVVNISDPQQLPTRWYGYESVDAVILSTSRPRLYDKFANDDNTRKTALKEWIRMGGRLVLTVGAAAEEVLAAGMPLEDFAPGRLERMVKLRHSRGWQSYADSSVAFAGAGNAATSVPRLVELQGKVEAWEADLPLVVRAAFGFGQIVFAAADLDREPLINWPDRHRLMARLLGLDVSANQSDEQSTAMMHYGFDDISGQLRSALDRFHGVRLVPFGAVVALIVLYIIFIGPADYFFLKKVAGRMQWTWVTFPLVVLLFCAGAYYLACYLKGDRLRVNRVDLVDVDAAAGFVRGTGWANVFSPRTQAYDIAFRPNVPGALASGNVQSLTAWLGLPGSGLGGMAQRGDSGLAWRRHYDFTPKLDAMSGVPVQLWSSKSFTGRWQGTCRMFPKARLHAVDDLLEGHITNTFDFPLRDCLVAFDRWVYQFDSIEPGQSVRIRDARRQGTLQTLLTGRHRIMDDDQVRQAVTPYDVGSTNIPYILREMMFFKASGGKNYAQLRNRYQAFVDFSDLIRLNRAVLVAYAPGAAAAKVPGGEDCFHGGSELLIDGRPADADSQQQTTVYRFVFEVNVDDKNAKSY